MRKKISVLFVAAIAIALLLTACTVEVTLDFVVDGEVYASVETTGKEAIQMPQDPAKEGYIFDGWYWDKDVWEQPFTVNSLLEMPLSTNMTVYAKWEEAPHVHTYGDWTVVTPATCTVEGQKKRVCSCGAEETAAIPKLAHTYGEWTVVTQATCTAEGLQKHTCSVCGTEETAAIPKLEHTYVTKHDAANHWDECSVCQEKVNITAHSFGAWEVVTPATCTAEGQKKRVCSCGTEETEVIPKLEHNYVTKHDVNNHWEECSVCHETVNATAHTFGEWTDVTPATCTAEGQKKHTCTVCRLEETAVITVAAHTYETKHDEINHWSECSVCHETVNATAHTFGEWTDVTPATCTAEGQKKHVCSCGAEETEAIQKLEHSYGAWTVVTPATCTAEGLQKRTCSVCGIEETAVIEKLAHTYETKHDATNHWEECSVCQDKINVTAHTYGDWTVVTPATCTAEGEKKHVCACGAEETEAIQKLEHSYGAWTVVTPATCTAEGLQKRTCSVCGIEETAVIEKLAHTYETKHDATNHWEECSVCQDKINVTAHTYGDWTVVTAATCTAEGEKKHGCTVCNAEQTAVIPKLAHTYGEWTVVTQATCTAEGLKKHNCSVCGTEETAVIEKLPHSNTMKYDDTNHWSECSVCGETSNPEAHTYVNDVCTVCNRVYGTQGLAYTRITNGYSVSGIGSAGSNAKIEIPSLYEGEPVTEIGIYAFQNCGFTAIAIPNSVTSIGDAAFYGTGIWNNAEENSVVYADKWAIGYKGDNATLSGALTLKADTVGISSYAFRGCSSLTSITIPDSVTSIGDNAFDGCSSLTSVAIPNSVTSIGDYAFYYCSNLTGIAIPNSVTGIGDRAFSGCSSLTSIAIPDSVTSIGYSAFYECNGLTIYTEAAAKPSGWESIGRPVVWDYKNNDVADDGYIYTIQNGIRYGIKDGAAKVAGQPSNITEANVASEIVYKETRYSVTSIGNHAFYGCSSLTSVAIPNGVTSIGAGAFAQCSGLQRVEIPQSVTSIENFAFQYCGSLQSITIPNSVTSIGNNAFTNCSSLQSIAIPEGVTTIGSGAFSYCGSLETITVAEGNTKYHSAGNCLIETEMKMLIAGCKNSVIPTDGSVTSIGDYAFSGCTGLQSIAIPNRVIVIGNDAFSVCGNLTSIEYQGTKTEWKAIMKASSWNRSTGEYTVTCTDGTLSKAES